MNKENCALKLVDEIILYYDARSKKKHQNTSQLMLYREIMAVCSEIPINPKHVSKLCG